MDLTILVPVIMAVVQGAKMSGMDSKYAFSVSVALGILAMYFLGDGAVAERVFEGVVSGLSASGLYSGAAKALRQ